MGLGMAWGFGRGVTLARQARRLVKLARLLRRPAYRAGLRLGVPAGIEAERLLAAAARAVGEPAVVIDVGANRGQFALVAATAFPAARLIACEPLPEAAAVLERLLERLPAGRPGSTVHRLAVGETAGEADFHVSGRPDCSSLLPIGAAQAAAEPGAAAVAVRRVTVAPLDAVVDAAGLPAGPLLLKIDVQGAELAVLRGAPRLLARAAAVLVEVSFVPLYDGQALAGTVIAHLEAAGFRLAGVDQPWFGPDGACLQADLLFLRPG